MPVLVLEPFPVPVPAPSLVQRSPDNTSPSQRPDRANTGCLLQGLCGNPVPRGLSRARKSPKSTDIKEPSAQGAVLGQSGACQEAAP